MSSPEFNGTRKNVVKDARGTVLEIGFGSGHNLPFYTGVDHLYALEPSEELYAYAKERIANVVFPVTHLSSGAEDIGLPDASVDTVVSTWTLCSVADITQSLKEIKRVLKPGGRFFFAEHGVSQQSLWRMFQKIVTPFSRHCTGNCHLDRDIEKAICEAGLVINDIQKVKEDGRPLMVSYRGVAKK